jgi:hypothetical protein
LAAFPDHSRAPASAGPSEEEVQEEEEAQEALGFRREEVQEEKEEALSG